MESWKQSGTPIPPLNRNGGCNQSIQQPEIIIRLKRGELTKVEEVINYCKKISEELAATSKLRLEVDMTI